MATLDIGNSRTASRIKLVVACDHCGHKSTEPLSRFHGGTMLVCRECASIVNLKAKDNQLVLDELAKLCGKIDAAFGEEKQRH